MITNALLGFVLHKRATGDTSADVTFFTREKGLLRARATGGRTPKKQALLQPFTPLWLVLDEKRYGHYVRQLEASACMNTLPGQALFAGLYVNELLYHVLQPHQEEDVLFSAYEDVIQHLMAVNDAQTSIEIALRRFEWTLLDVSGYLVSFTTEANSDVPILPHKAYRFVPGAGFLCVNEGFSGAHILAMAADEWRDMSVLKTAKWIMRKAVDHLLDGTPIQTRALYRV